MLKKITIPPVPIIIIDRPKIDEIGFMTLNYEDIKINTKVKYPMKEINFSTKIGQTEYEVSSVFDSLGNKTLLSQFKNLILSQN